MRSVFHLILLLLSCSFTYCAGKQDANALNILSIVNAEWPKQADGILLAEKELAVASANYNDWIKMHLRLVEQTLRERPTDKLSPEQRSSRLKLLDELHGYWQAGVFPLNDYTNYKTPVFIDRLGTHCAVGYLMQKSGADQLAQKVNANEKFAYVHEIKTAGVTDWAAGNGFTMDELAWIQPSYPANGHLDSIGGGTNGDVTSATVTIVAGTGWKVVVAGTFTEVDHTPCDNIASITNGHLDCYGGGLNGTISDLAPYGTNGGVLVAGSFTDWNLIHHPVAKYNGGWTYVDIPGHAGATASAVNTPYSQWIDVAISDSSLGGKQEVWQYGANATWVRQATVYGKVNDIASDGNYVAVYAGVFDSILIHQPHDTMIYTKNVAIRTNIWQGVGNEVSDTVMVARIIGNALYLGGAGTTSTTKSAYFLSRYLNNSLQPLICSPPLPSFPFYHISVNDVQLYGDQLAVGGDFDLDNGFTYGNNFVFYDLAQSSYGAYTVLDKPVKAIAVLQGDLYLGGEFTAYTTLNKPLNHLAKISAPTLVKETIAQGAFSIYPNPANESVTIAADEAGDYDLQLLNLEGEQLAVYKFNKESSISTAVLANGVYLLRFSSKQGAATNTRRLIVMH